MKKIIIMSCIVFASAFQSIAQDNSLGQQRANKLSDQMIRDLRLNNFQASRLRAINQEKVNKMMEIETKFAANPDLVEKNCKGVCKERDKELEGFLSSDQYSKYFSSRTQYYKVDKDFAAQIGAKNTATVKNDKVNLPIGTKAPVVKSSATVLKQADSK